MNFIKFLQSYWREILTVFLVIASLVIFILKKKPKINEMDNIILEVLVKLPEFINNAECIVGAEAKKSLVIECCKGFVKDQFNVDLPVSYLASLGNCIEAILSTPQKHTEVQK